MTFPKALPHGPIEEIFDNVFFVTGGFSPGAGVRITRNMTVVRRGEELTVFNSVRLSPEGEEKLAKLGKVKHVVRLGAFHGYDDPYYADRFGVPIWGPPRTKHNASLRETREFRPNDNPLSNSTVFEFEKGKEPESAVILEQDGGILVTCDSYQNWTTFDGSSFLGKVVLGMMGFGPMHVGGPWTRAMGPAVREDLERLRKQPFRHLVPAHGTPLRDTAVEGLGVAIQKRFG